MSTPDSNSKNGPPQDPELRLRPALSQRQKQRSKLMQVDEVTAEEPPTPAPLPGPPSKSVPETPARRIKLKRSGQMHAGLTAPIPPDPTKDEEEY